MSAAVQGTVGNEHSYAADEEDNPDASLSGAAAGEDAATPGTSGWGRPLIPVDESSEIDLSIVKSEPGTYYYLSKYLIFFIVC